MITVQKFPNTFSCCYTDIIKKIYKSFRGAVDTTSLHPKGKIADITLREKLFTSKKNCERKGILTVVIYLLISKETLFNLILSISTENTKKKRIRIMN